MRAKRRFFHKENGQAAVEFALVLPIFLLLICGIIEFGMLFSSQLSIKQYAREGARYAAVHSDDGDAASYVSEQIGTEPFITNVNVSVVYSDANPSDGSVTVTVTGNAEPLTPLGELLFSVDGKVISSEVTMKVE
jgi:Flp pilus assembly protein TadG